MKLLKQYQFWVSLVVGLVLFAGTYPFYHDIYIAKVFTGVCICLNALSAILFGRFLFCGWTNRIDADSRARFILGTILQAIGHVVFSIMNWGSWLFLGLSVILFVILIVSYFREKKQ